jgi:hypothetical protein
MDIRLLSGRDCSHRANSQGELNLAVVSSSLGMKTSSTEFLGLPFSSIVNICSINQQLCYNQKEWTATQSHQQKNEKLPKERMLERGYYLFKSSSNKLRSRYLRSKSLA